MPDDQTTFAAKQVCKALEIPHGTLNSWAHAGYFKNFDAAKTTPGKAREFTFDDVVKLGIISHLSNLGLSKDMIVVVIEEWTTHQATFKESIMKVLCYSDGFNIVGQEAPSAGALVELIINTGHIYDELSYRLVPGYAGRAPNRAPDAVQAGDAGLMASSK